MQDPKPKYKKTIQKQSEDNSSENNYREYYDSFEDPQKVRDFEWKELLGKIKDLDED